MKDQPVVDLLEQGGTRQPAESACGENSHLQILLSGGWLRAIQQYLDSLDEQSPDWYSGLKGAWGAEGDVVCEGGEGLLKARGGVNG